MAQTKSWSTAGLMAMMAVATGESGGPGKTLLESLLTLEVVSATCGVN